VYNTYVIDTDYENWALIMHCAEKKKYPRYLSALMMSRKQTLGSNVKVFLREKLPKYNIDLDFMFEVRQDNCDNLSSSMNMKDYYETVLKYKESNEVESVENLNK
jgi:apolipoprotein D and lipocalin family protein